jgi:hypothetical protein
MSQFYEVSILEYGFSSSEYTYEEDNSEYGSSSRESTSEEDSVNDSSSGESLEETEWQLEPELW